MPKINFLGTPEVVEKQFMEKQRESMCFNNGLQKSPLAAHANRLDQNTYTHRACKETNTYSRKTMHPDSWQLGVALVFAFSNNALVLAFLDRSLLTHCPPLSCVLLHILLFIILDKYIGSNHTAFRWHEIWYNVTTLDPKQITSYTSYFSHSAVLFLPSLTWGDTIKITAELSWVCSNRHSITL